jgi:hypothetical protein
VEERPLAAGPRVVVQGLAERYTDTERNDHRDRDQDPVPRRVAGASARAQVARVRCAAVVDHGW